MTGLKCKLEGSRDVAAVASSVGHMIGTTFIELQSLPSTLLPHLQFVGP